MTRYFSNRTEIVHAYYYILKSIKRFNLNLHLLKKDQEEQIVK